MSRKQCTINHDISLSGKGLHTGNDVTLTFKSAAINAGIVFVRVDLPVKPSIKVSAKTIVMDKAVSRCSMLEYEGVRVMTIEHVMAALRGLGIDNIIIEMNAIEAPGMDGSSEPFIQALLKSGLMPLDALVQECVITKPLLVENDHASIMITPSDSFNINYTLDYPHPLLSQQRFGWTMNNDSFVKEIAPSRTFCLASEREAIKKAGLGLGANTANTVVMGDNGPIDNSLRFNNECCRHKILDIVGDLYMLGVPIRGTVHATKSGHALNRALVQRIYQQWNTTMLPIQAQRIFDIDEIKTILPHRYPFLFIDRVFEIKKGERGVGTKNVTINENFFQGHFPDRPIMPGVIMVEALAQVSGVLMYASGNHDGKLALFMGIDEVKFRRMVVPGDQLVIEVEVLRDRERTVQLKGIGRVDGEIAFEATIILSYANNTILPKNEQ